MKLEKYENLFGIEFESSSDEICNDSIEQDFVNLDDLSEKEGVKNYRNKLSEELERVKKMMNK